MGGVLRKLGSMVVNGVWQLGFAARFFWLILVYSGQSFTRLHLTIRELYFSGVLSLLPSSTRITSVGCAMLSSTASNRRNVSETTASSL